MTSVSPPLLCKSLPSLPVLLWKRENESFLRENEKVNERKPGLSVSHLLFLKPELYGAQCKTQRGDVGPAFKELNVQLGEKTNRPESLS